jgi:hypothetical protein
MRRLVSAFKLSAILAIACCVNLLPNWGNADIACTVDDKLCRLRRTNRSLEWCCPKDYSCGVSADTCDAPPTRRLHSTTEEMLCRNKSAVQQIYLLRNQRNLRSYNRHGWNSGSYLLKDENKELFFRRGSRILPDFLFRT